MRKRRRWLLVAAVVLAVGLSYVAYSLFIHSGANYLTVIASPSHWASVQVRALPYSVIKVLFVF